MGSSRLILEGTMWAGLSRKWPSLWPCRLGSVCRGCEVDSAPCGRRSCRSRDVETVASRVRDWNSKQTSLPRVEDVGSAAKRMLGEARGEVLCRPRGQL